MKNGRYRDESLLRQRRALAEQTLADGGNLAELARRMGTSHVWAGQYMARYMPYLHDRLRGNNNKSLLSPAVILDRLRVLSRHRFRSHAAREVGITPGAMTLFIQTYAPNGIAEALADYEEAYGSGVAA